MTTIILTNSDEVALVDDNMAHLSRFDWKINTSGYACRTVNRQFVFLHHIVLGVQTQRGRHVDHIDHDKLNNRIANLRVVTVSQNAQNRPKITSRGTYRGVSWKAEHGKWAARATINYKTHHVGYFETQEEAAEAVSAWRARHMTHSDADRVIGAGA